jgi:hypothetical protein
MKMRKLLAIPGFVFLAIGSFLVYLGMRISHFMAISGTASSGFFMVIIGVFLILLSGIFKGVLEKRWGHQ